MQAPVGDLPLMLLLASKGKIGYIDEVMSVYRIMSTNSWSASMKNFEKRKKHYLLILKMWNKFDEWSNKKYSILVLRRKFIIKCFFIKFKLKRLLNICRIFS
jgi:hypothetical protein